MKKVFKVICACLLMCGVIALIVCMCVIPNETKEFFNVVFDYLDRPIVLCGVSITLGGVLGYFIVRYVLNNTSYGKKYLKELKEDLEKEKDRVESYYKNLKDLIDYNVDNGNNHFDKVNETINKFENALKQVPNKKVQEALNNGKKTKDN